MEAGRVLCEKDGYHGMYMCSITRLEVICVTGGIEQG